MKILALDIGGTQIKSALFEDGHIVEKKMAASHTEEEESKEKNAIRLARSYGKVDGVGVAITGQVDTEKQTVLFQYGVKTDAEGVQFPVGKLLQEGIGEKVFVLNDANAAALGEARFGNARQYKDMLMLTIGTGVGGGIVLGGKLFTGTRGIAGEMGHIVTHAFGDKICGCGNRGCFECYASTTALLKNAASAGYPVQSGKEFFTRLETKPGLQKVLDAWCCEVVEGLCTLTYIFNPPCIVLGGGIMEQGKVLENIRKKFMCRIIPTFSRVALLPASLGNEAGLYGAYAYALEKINGRDEERKGFTKE